MFEGGDGFCRHIPVGQDVRRYGDVTFFGLGQPPLPNFGPIGLALRINEALVNFVLVHSQSQRTAIGTLVGGAWSTRGRGSRFARGPGSSERGGWFSRRGQQTRGHHRSTLIISDVFHGHHLVFGHPNYFFPRKGCLADTRDQRLICTGPFQLCSKLYRQPGHKKPCQAVG